MGASRLVFGLLDTAKEIPDPFVAARLRDLTIAWSRFKYFGSIIECETVDGLLAQALTRGADHCLVQSHGHVLDEVWHPDGGEALDVMAVLEHWVEDHDFLVTGHIVSTADGGCGLDNGFLLVDLGCYRALGCPAFGQPGGDARSVLRPNAVAADGVRVGRLDPTDETVSLVPAAPGWSLVDASLRAGVPVYGFPAAVAAGSVDIRPKDTAELSFLRRRLAIDDLDPAGAPGSAPGAARGRRFFATLDTLTTNLPRGVFAWNLEGYADIETPPEGFEPPLRALYTVAAGFKPNRILETHGFDADTRMVVFDYSRPGLAFRRLLHDRWDGTDYPDFLRALFREREVADAFYILWDGATPETVHWPDVEARWRAELRAWAGARSLRDHWRRFRELRVDYVRCDILANPSLLFESVRNETAAVIWWSNAFFSIHSNWFYSASDRRARYRNFIAALAARAPDLYLYGADCNNIAVNFVQAASYCDWFIRAGGNDLEPAKWHRHQIRF